MRCVENYQSINQLRAVHRQPPGNNATPVMADHARAALAQLPDQSGNIVSNDLETVALDPPRLVGQVVAAQVWGHHAAARCGKGGDLMSPGVPELGKSVQQHSERAAAGYNVME